VELSSTRLSATTGSGAASNCISGWSVHAGRGGATSRTHCRCNTAGRSSDDGLRGGADLTVNNDTHRNNSAIPEPTSGRPARRRIMGGGVFRLGRANQVRRQAESPLPATLIKLLYQVEG